jgi:inositol-phosphate phosphatase/L-galactose 1-phosphate phosphatase/histidinol-phosphatase
MTYLPYLPFFKELAAASGKLIAGYYRNHGTADDKADKSPVTIADCRAEMLMREMIERAYPAYGIIGEEYGKIREDAEYVFVLDPIDGTISFTIGRPIFGTLAALVHKGKPVIGMIHQPITDECWIGIPEDRHGVLYHQGKEIRMQSNPTPSLKQSVIATTGPQYFNEKQARHYGRIEKLCKRSVYGGDCYNYGLITTGGVDLVIEAGLKTHDFCALAPVVEASGGVFTDWFGKPMTLESDGNVIAAANSALHEEALGLLP